MHAAWDYDCSFCFNRARGGRANLTTCGLTAYSFRTMFCTYIFVQGIKQGQRGVLPRKEMHLFDRFAFFRKGFLYLCHVDEPCAT